MSNPNLNRMEDGIQRDCVFCCASTPDEGFESEILSIGGDSIFICDTCISDMAAQLGIKRLPGVRWEELPGLEYQAMVGGQTVGYVASYGHRWRLKAVGIIRLIHDGIKFYDSLPEAKAAVETAWAEFSGKLAAEPPE